jgi:hypothetical protein
MPGCEDCRQEPIDPLIGREAWRQARLTDATGPTGPTGVVQDMRSPAGSYSAVVESNLCGCGPIGLIASTGRWSFDLVFPDFQRYRDGTYRFYALADETLSRGVWAEIDVPPLTTYPIDDVPQRGRWPLFFTRTQIEEIPTLVESGDYIAATRPAFVENGWYANQSQAPTFFQIGGFLITGPVRFRCGFGSEVVKDLSGLRGVTTSSVLATVAIMPSDHFATETFSVGVELTFDGYGATFPITVSASDLFNDEPPSNLYHGIKFVYDPTRIVSSYPGTPPNGFSSIPVGCSLQQRAVTDSNRTNAFIEPFVTVPYRSRTLYYNGKDGQRPDLHHDPQCYSVDGPAWHEDAIIRGPWALAQNGAKHKFDLTFPPAPQSTTRGQRRQNIGFARRDLAVFGSTAVEFQLNPNPAWFAGGQTMRFRPVCAGRELLPRMYASGFKQFSTTTLSSLDAFTNSGGLFFDQLTVPCDIDIQPMCHAFAFTEKLVASGGLPGASVQEGFGGPVFTNTEYPFNAELQYDSLPLPGVDGMKLDLYSIYGPPTGHRTLHMLGATLNIYFQWWFKITARNIDGISLNRVWYRSPNLPSQFSGESIHNRILLAINNQKCARISNGDNQVAFVDSASFSSSTFGLYAKAISDPGPNAYGLEFSLFNPAD